MQVLAEGDLSERARKRALEIANDADLRVQPTKAFLKGAVPVGRDARLPAADTVLRRKFKGEVIVPATFEAIALSDLYMWPPYSKP
jgi:hypothetical protein